MQYYIFNSQTKEPWFDAQNDIAYFGSQDEAMVACRVLRQAAFHWREADKSVWHIAERKENWEDREINRFKTKVYKPVPWAKNAQWKAWLKAFPEMKRHHLHMAMKDPKSIAYTSDITNGEQDKQTKISPEAYLRKFVTEPSFAVHIPQWLALM